MSAPEGRNSAVYTVLLGGYEKLNDAQNIGDGSIPFLCFTDDERLTSDVWQIRLVEPLFGRDLQRSQREFKIRGCVELDKYDETLYIDNSVSLTVPPREVLSSWLAGGDVAIPLHSFRANVLDEFLAVIELGYDEPARVYEQLYHYSESDPSVLGQRPTWNGIIARRNTDPVRAAMSRWFDEVLRYSRRDQLSANRILGELGDRFHPVELDNNSSPIHQWPVSVERISPRDRWSKIRVLPDEARLRELQTYLAQETHRAEVSEREIVDIRATRSWALAERISRVASALRISRGSRTRKSGS